MFLYNDYWRTWNRVLLNDFGNGSTTGQFVELNLTHVNGDWSRVKDETIRVHCTRRSTKDRLTALLPADILHVMRQQIGGLLTERLMVYDYIAEIDWLKYERLSRNGGGVPFDQCNILNKEMSRG